jgi:hypothetical protein
MTAAIGIHGELIYDAVCSQTGESYFGEYDITSATVSQAFPVPTDYSAWKCREKIKVVSPNTGESVSTVVIAYDSDMNTDFSDIRFSTLNGINIPYSLKTKTNSTSAVFDLWMPSDDIRVYLYYGNSDAESESSEASTHLDKPLFDLSFDNLTLSNTGTSSTGLSQLNTVVAKSRFDLSTYDARSFPGSSYILLTSANELQGLQEFTYRTYVNYSSSAANGYGGIFRGINGCVGDSRLYVNASDNSLVLQENGTTVGTSAASVIADDTWQLVEMTFDGTTTNVYVDGTNVITTSTPDWTSSASAIYIGRGYTDNTYDFEGKIDDVKIYNYVTRVSEAVLTEMTKDYNPYYLGYTWNCMREVKAIDITDAPTIDAQVEITVAAPTGMYSSSFDDVRFATDDGGWIDFYRVSYTSGVSAVFGLELPANTTRIKMYYGNTEAEYTGDSELFGTLNTTPTFTFNPAGYNIGYYLYDWTGFKHQSTIIVEDIPEKHTPTKLTLTKADYTLNTDLSDMRFCDVDGNYLPLWVEANDTTVTVWTVTPKDATRFFMRSGDSTATSESNDTFVKYVIDGEFENTAHVNRYWKWYNEPSIWDIGETYTGDLYWKYYNGDSVPEYIRSFSTCGIEYTSKLSAHVSFDISGTGTFDKNYNRIIYRISHDATNYLDFAVQRSYGTREIRLTQVVNGTSSNIVSIITWSVSSSLDDIDFLIDIDDGKLTVDYKRGSGDTNYINAVTDFVLNKDTYKYDSLLSYTGGGSDSSARIYYSGITLYNTDCVLYPLPEGYSPAYIVPLSERQVFPYRSTLTVNNPHTDNYPVQKTVAWETGMETDFSDVWFIDATTYKRCPHWVESYTSGTSAVIWIQTPANLSSVYMLFGESTVEDVSNIEQVFILGDGFDGSIDTVINSNKFDISTLNSGGTALHDGNGNLVIKPVDSQSCSIAVNTRMVCGLGTEFIVHEKQSVDQRYPDTLFGTGDIHEYLGLSTWHPAVSIGGLSVFVQNSTYDTNADLFQYIGNGIYVELASSTSAHSPILETYYYHSYVISTGLFKVVRDFTTQMVIYNETPLATDVHMYLVQSNHSSISNSPQRIIDWVGIREYVATEPTISIGTAGANPEYVGGEEPTYNLLVGFTGSNF